MIRCADGALYTGITTDVERRIGEHRSGGEKGAKCLRGRGPLAVVLSRGVGDRRSALKVEARIKRAPKQTKEAWIADPSGIDQLLEAGREGDSRSRRRAGSGSSRRQQSGGRKAGTDIPNVTTEIQPGK